MMESAPTIRKMAPPTPTPETERLWAATERGALLIKRCGSCHKAHWYPRAFCPFCYSVEVEWTEASGKGVIYSFSVVHRAEIPYVVAYVTLAEGPTMMTNIVGARFESLAIGQPVTVAFVPTDGHPVPCFTPDAR